MRLLVGLGNPGPKYQGTRHNVGFDVVDAAAENLGVTTWKTFKDGLLAEAGSGEDKVLLFKPQQFMNNSGVQVRQLVDFYQLSSPDMAVAYDDVYIQPGSIRIRQGGGDSGHNGMKSLHTHLTDHAFWRLRVGAGLYEQNPELRHHLPSLEDYVVQKFQVSDAKKVQKLIDNQVSNLVQWLKLGTGLQEQTVHTP
jgi:PTH1 family peptidyl-tRNA hydrolase